MLHDFSYHHFFAHKCFEELHNPPAYARFIREYYGSAGFNMALRSGVITRDATLYAPWDGENVIDYPLMQPLASLASAVVVHSRFMEERVAQFFKGPILRLFLPSDQKVAPAVNDMAAWRAETAGRERCQFATFGHIGRPKCLDIVIQAIASSPVLRARSQFVIAGHPGDKEYVREIEAMVAKLGLSRQVVFEYSVTNERLLAIKNDTDVFLNLRFPQHRRRIRVSDRDDECGQADHRLSFGLLCRSAGRCGGPDRQGRGQRRGGESDGRPAVEFGAPHRGRSRGASPCSQTRQPRICPVFQEIRAGHSRGHQAPRALHHAGARCDDVECGGRGRIRRRLVRGTDARTGARSCFWNATAARIRPRYS